MIEKIFETPEFGEIRTQIKDGTAMFCLVDVCRALGIGNSRDVVKRLKQDGVDSIDGVDSLGRKNTITFIDEPNLYRCIFQSRKETAVRFSDWVCEEVLPALRKEGYYKLDKEIETLKSINEAQASKIINDEPKVKIAESMRN